MFLRWRCGEVELSSALESRTYPKARGGLLTPALYRLRGSAAITDVVPQKAGVWTPSMHVFGGVTVPTAAGSYLIDFDARPQNLQSGTGWDPVTGLGTPAAGFIAALAK